MTNALRVAGVSVLGLLLLLVAVVTPWGQRLDDAGQRHSLITWNQRVALMDAISQVTLAGAVIAIGSMVAWAWWRRLPMHALAVVIVVAGANLSTFIIKHYLLSRPDFGLGVENTLPSGHVTAGMSTALALVLVAPPKVRVTASVVATIVAAPQAFLTIAVSGHRPSDVIAAALVAMTWAALAIAFLARTNERRIGSQPTRRRAAAMLALATLALVATLVVTSPLNAQSDDAQPGEFVVLAITALASTLVIGMTSALIGQLDRRPQLDRVA